MQRLVILWARLNDRLVNVRNGLQLVWDAAPGWTIAWLVLLVLLGLQPIASLYILQLAVDSLTSLVISWTPETLQVTLGYFGILVLAYLGYFILNGLLSLVKAVRAELLKDHINEMIFTQSTKLDLAFFETPDYYDMLHRAQTQVSSAPITLLDNIGNIIQYGITLLSVAGVLITLNIWLPLALGIGILPTFYVAVRHSYREYEWQRTRTPLQRRADYYSSVLTSRETAAEVRLFQLDGLFQTLYRNLRKEFRTEYFSLIRDREISRIVAIMFAYAVAGISAVITLITGLGSQDLSVGQVLVLFQTLMMGQSLMSSILSAVNQIYQTSLFTSHLFEFLALKPILSSPTHPAQGIPDKIQGEISFKHVTFRYPGSQRMAVDDLSLAIPAGRIIAIVGENGAGKSTLIKLLCRFYDPEAGEITIDGIPLTHLDIDQLRNLITVLFQQPVQYHDTASGNIAISALSKHPDSDAIIAAAEAAGADVPINRLPQAYETVLGKWFGGEDLSVGEWQRIALARAFIRQAPIVLLDEPTSAMDSWAEADWLRRIRQLVAGRIAIIITHRFTTAMQADEIHVMEQGRIVESGHHEQLMRLNGRYAQSWRSQMRQEGAESVAIK